MQGAPAFSRTIYRPLGGAACYRIPQRASRAASTDRAAEQEARRERSIGLLPLRHRVVAVYQYTLNEHWAKTFRFLAIGL